ncbi:hypothetical protein Tco_0792782 [Tanacetum coccineum]
MIKSDFVEYVLWKTLTRLHSVLLGPPSDLKGLLHMLNATVIPTEVYAFGISLSCSYTGNAHDDGARISSSCNEHPERPSWNVYSDDDELLCL